MESTKKTVKQLLCLLAVVFIFASINFSLYLLLTCRLSNNFSGATQAKMVDVGKYLPHVEDSELPKVDCSLKLTENLPVLDGAAALVPVYAAIIDNVYPEGSVKYEGGVFSDDNYYGENFAPDSKMQYKNTVRGYRAIVDGDTDILFCASPSEEQKRYAEEKGVELVYVPVGLEAFVFFVNVQNPVDTLTCQQVRDIYGGAVTNWAEVGGANRTINPVTRLEGSGSQSAMNAFMAGRPYGKKSLSAIGGASIGFSFRFYLEDMVDNGAVKTLALEGVLPTAENIRSGAYPVSVPFYAIYRADNDNENLPRLVEWLLSDEGQLLIEQSGYIPIR